MAFFSSRASSNRRMLAKQVAVLISKISLLLLIIISLVLFSLNRFRTDNVEPVRTKTAQVLYVFNGFIYRFVDGITVVVKEIDYLLHANTMTKRLQILEQENFKTKLALYLSEQENSDLRKQVNYIPAKERKFYSARVISQSSGAYVRAGFIRSDDVVNLEKDNVVINQDGLVGQIEAISGDVANVILITDKRSNIPVKAKNSGKRAILVGTGTNNPELDFVLSTKGLTIGEEILTSGDGGIFPPDLPIGYIEKIENDRVIIATYVDWSSLNYVFILK